jgi:hypothetical protein
MTDVASHVAQSEAAIVFCDAANQKGGRCTTPATTFEIPRGGLKRIYVNWTVPKGQTVKEWTRRWSFFPGGNEPTTCLFSTTGALKPKVIAEGSLYQVVFSAAEGNGPKVFYTPNLIYGDYTLELFADGAPAGKATFEVRARFGGDVPIKASLC